MKQLKGLSNRYFKMWGYAISHKVLILRSEMKYSDQYDYSEYNNFNIDIEFTKVSYIDLPCIPFKIKQIRNIEKNILDKMLINKFEELLDQYNYIFEIESENRKYYIIAENYLMGTNKWMSQIRTLDFMLEYDEVLEISLSNLDTHIS